MRNSFVNRITFRVATERAHQNNKSRVNSTNKCFEQYGTGAAVCSCMWLHSPQISWLKTWKEWGKLCFCFPGHYEVLNWKINLRKLRTRVLRLLYSGYCVIKLDFARQQGRRVALILIVSDKWVSWEELSALIFIFCAFLLLLLVEIYFVNVIASVAIFCNLCTRYTKSR